jgi:hypothetical protein
MRLIGLNTAIIKKGHITLTCGQRMVTNNLTKSEYGISAMKLMACHGNSAIKMRRII